MQLEAAVKRNIRAWLREFGGHWKSNGAGPYSSPGAPDIDGVYRGRAVYIEAKTAKGRLTPPQKNFLRAAHANGGVVIVPRSTDDVKTVMVLLRENPFADIPLPAEVNA